MLADEPEEPARRVVDAIRACFKCPANRNRRVGKMPTEGIKDKGDILDFDRYLHLSAQRLINQNVPMNPPISPPRIRALSDELLELCHGDPSESENFSRYFRQVAEARRLCFLDAAEMVEPSSVNGVHLDEAGHAVPGRAVAREVLKIFREKT